MPLTPLTSAWPPSLPFGTDLLRDARDLGGEAVELIDHRVDGVLDLEHLALRVDGDLLREVAARDGGRHLGDVADLRGQVVGQQVDVVGQVAPDAGGLGHLGLAAQLAVGTDLLRDARDLGRERRQLIDHAVDGRADAQELALDLLALDLERHLLGEVALGDGADDARDLGGRLHQVADERVDRSDAGGPAAVHLAQRDALGHPALAADDPLDANHLAGQRLVEPHHRVELSRDGAHHLGVDPARVRSSARLAVGAALPSCAGSKRNRTEKSPCRAARSEASKRPRAPP